MIIPKKKNFDLLSKWFKGLCKESAPFSFTLKDIKGLNGAEKSKTYSFKTVNARWKRKIAEGFDADKNKTVQATYTDSESGLEFALDATLYSDVPAIDYVVSVTNLSKDKCSPVISGLSSLDCVFPLSADGGKFKLGNGRGSTAKNSDFEQKTYELTDKQEFSEIYGRSTDDAWPYFDIDGKDGGILLAIGWSGNWHSEFSKTASDELGIKVDLLNFNSFLLPQEKIRSERIVILAHDGDNEYGHNLFRRMIINHYTPYCRQHKPFTSPICINFWGGRNTAFITKVAKKYADAGIKADVVWMDAAWYGNYPFMGEDFSVGWNDNTGGPWYAQLGIWEDNKNLYPHGIKEVGRYLHENTPYKLMLWWMLEDGRVNPFEITYNVGNGETKTIKQNVIDNQTFGKDSYYRELIDIPGGRTVLKLSDEKVFKKVLNYYRNRFSNDNIDNMRIDYWSRPAAAWLTNDKDEAIELAGEKFAEYRGGMTENKYICNLYRFFDTMYEEYPDWMLDNCASGGRRLDIEMALRAIPLWRTDYNNASVPDYCEANQVQTQYLSRWLPLTGIGVTYPKESNYYPRSFYCAGPCIGSAKHNDYELSRIKKMVDEYVDIRPYWYGNYYQLLPVANNKESWQAYELFREDLGEGMLVSIIRENTVETEKKGKLVKTFRLRGLEKDKKYLIHDFDDSEGKNDYIASGAVLMKKGIRCEGLARSIQNHIIKEVK